MSANPSPPQSEPLDERTEWFFSEIIYHASKGRVGTVEATVTALRNRVRELIKQTRHEESQWIRDNQTPKTWTSNR